MASIADSSAILEKKRLLPQHQAALTLIQGKVGRPSINVFRWLDLCCGRGQIIVNLDDNFPEHIRQKIEFYIQDINEQYLKTTQKTAEGLKFRHVESYTTDISKFMSIIPEEPKRDFITLINATHEISPTFLPELFYECIIRLTDSGSLYVYDMETIHPLELGAITWKAEEIQELINTLTQDILAYQYYPTANRWHHSSCDAWSFELSQELLLPTSEIINKKDSIIEATKAKVQEILSRKLKLCTIALESFTKYGAQTPEDEISKTQSLFEFYSLNRILK